MFLLFTTLGSIWRINDVVSSGVMNNWIEDRSWNWSKEIVLITGGSGGIGASIVRQLLHRNATTTIVVVDYMPLTFSPPPDSRVHYYHCDLTDSAAIQRTCEAVRTQVGFVTVLINNAGLTRGQTIMGGKHVDVETTFRTNLIAPFLMAKEVLPHMVARNHGHIINVASMSAMITPANLADYGASKAGLLVMQEALRQELRFVHHAPCVRASVAILGFINTPMFKGETNQSRFLAPLIHVDTVGEAIVNQLYRAESGEIWLPGFLRCIGFLRGCPVWLTETMRNSTQTLAVDYIGRQKIDAQTGHLQNRTDRS